MSNLGEGLWKQEFTLDLTILRRSISNFISREDRLKQYKVIIGKAAVLFSEERGCLLFCGWHLV